jgi:hypothetical protein
MGSVRSFPQNDEAKQNKNIGAQVKNTVPQRVYLEIVNGICGITAACQHMVPLEHLMKNNAVEESTQARPSRIPGDIGKSL